ncbi:MAG: class I SAM-dependent methyltransferase, partial [Candidatus Lambdaproteobacteria bacterium]|nr:class I SAM-dependent methyltransferase [Candidatus Lambdaproteobacteria bacterium]
MESWLVDKYINLPLPVPGSVLQGLLNLYIDAFNRIGAVLYDQQRSYPPVEEIAACSRELMDTHYDQPRELFENFLGGAMKYSMGLWERGARTLEESQTQMLADVCDKARIEDGQAILDIGCGFG